MILLQATNNGDGQQGRAKTPAPATEQSAISAKLAQLRPLMASAQERERKSTRAVGWGEGGSLRQSVPTAAALQAHEQALSLAREILGATDSTVELAELRSILATHPMRDVDESHGFAGSAPPLLDEVNGKLGQLMK